MPRSLAEAVAENMRRYNTYPICCPYNVSQIGNDGKWIAIMPDRSILYCNYDTGTTETFPPIADDVNSWDEMNRIFSGEKINE